MSYTFANCSNFGSNITFLDSSKITSTKNMLLSTNNALRKNIFCDNATPFIGTVSTNSIVGAAITWTQDGSSIYYNTDYNIWIYGDGIGI